MYYIFRNFSNGANYARDLIYKKNHPVTTKQVLNVLTWDILHVRNDFTEQLSCLTMQKEKKPTRAI